MGPIPEISKLQDCAQLKCTCLEKATAYDVVCLKASERGDNMSSLGDQDWRS